MGGDNQIPDDDNNQIPDDDNNQIPDDDINNQIPDNGNGSAAGENIMHTGYSIYLLPSVTCRSTLKPGHYC